MIITLIIMILLIICNHVGLFTVGDEEQVRGSPPIERSPIQL